MNLATPDFPVFLKRYAYDADYSLNFHLRKAPSLNYQALHPGMNKQSVPLDLAIFYSKTSAAMREYMSLTQILRSEKIITNQILLKRDVDFVD